jgi:hypothetical protein
MANLQIKGIDDDLYAELKTLAASENRSVSQQVLFLLKDYLAKRHRLWNTKTPAQVLLELYGSWEDERSAEQIISELKKTRKNSRKLAKGF